jgi:hypothetical protein
LDADSLAWRHLEDEPLLLFLIHEHVLVLEVNRGWARQVFFQIGEFLRSCLLVEFCKKTGTLEAEKLTRVRVGVGLILVNYRNFVITRIARRRASRKTH